MRSYKLQVEEVGEVSYKPQPGDKVRATNGENVLVGELVARDDEREWFDLEFTALHRRFLLSAVDGWSFEPIVDPVVFKPLAVVRVADDALVVLGEDDQLFSDMTGTYGNPSGEFVRTAGDYWRQYEFPEIVLDDSDVERLLAAGKAEVLFEGVDSE